MVPEKNIEISGNNLYRVFKSATMAALNLSFLTISHGLASGGEGGAVLAFDALTVNNCTFSENKARDGGAIQARSGLFVKASTFSKNSATVNGGAIETSDAQILDSTFVENSSSRGGGALYTTKSILISNCTFTSNKVTGVGPSNGGGAIQTDPVGVTDSTIVNSTITGNSAQSGLGAGIFVSSQSVTLKNTLVAGNSGTDCGVYDLTRTISADSFNIDSDGSCDNATTKTLADLHLGALANNGGPTQTIAVLAGSAAINAGNNIDASALIYDQREVGFPRIACATVDVGAYELSTIFNGFFAPIDNYPIYNIVKAGKTVPLKFQVLDCFGVPITNLTAPPVKIVAKNVSCNLNSTADLIEEVSAGDSGLINKGDGEYQFNWKTPTSYANSCKEIYIDLGDGDPSHKALFKFTK